MSTSLASKQNESPKTLLGHTFNISRTVLYALKKKPLKKLAVFLDNDLFFRLRRSKMSPRVNKYASHEKLMSIKLSFSFSF